MARCPRAGMGVTVKAIRVDEHGGAEALQVVEVAEPQPAAGECVVDVKYVGLNRLDVWVRDGVPGHRFPLPLIPGADIVGVRQDTGEWVALHPAVSCMTCSRCLEGRHDLCRTYRIRGERCDGGMVERLAVPTWQCLPIGSIEPAKAAALPLALLTAWHMLNRAEVRAGQGVLVQSGAGGVSSLAIQLARLRGARVVATASSEEKRARCLQLGAEAAWPHDQLKSELKAWSGGEGVDVVVEHVGAATWASSVRSLRWGGSLVTCGATSGHEVSLDLRVLFFKQISLIGSTMGSLSELEDAWRVALQGDVCAVVDRELGAKGPRREGGTRRIRMTRSQSLMSLRPPSCVRSECDAVPLADSLDKYRILGQLQPQYSARDIDFPHLRLRLANLGDDRSDSGLGPGKRNGRGNHAC